jgi:hypothetical protein
MAEEEECIYFGTTTDTLAKFLIEVAAFHGAHNYAIICSTFFPNSTPYF